MIIVNEFDKFCSLVGELKSAGIQMKLLGSQYESFAGARSLGQKIINNHLTTKVVALTTLGTFFHQKSERLDHSEIIESNKRLYSKLGVTEAKLSIDKESGIVKIV